MTLPPGTDGVLPTKPVVANRGSVMVRTTLPPMSFRDPPALESGAAEKNPAKKRRTMRAAILGERAVAISKMVAMINVMPYTGNLPYTVLCQLT